MSVVPGGEAYHAEGGSTGVLVCHGFAGSGLSVRPWAEHLVAAGHTVSLPLMPGHGTRWQDLERTSWIDWYDEIERSFVTLRERCSDVFVFGLSMGGALALRVAQRHPRHVSGLVLVNPSVGTRSVKVRLLNRMPVITRFVRTSHGIGGDIKKPGMGETGYSTIPTRAVYQLTKLWRTVRADLPAVTAPTLVFRSSVDHVVDNRSIGLLRRGLGNPPEVRVLDNSYHVATLDHDAPTVFDGSLSWIATHSRSRENDLC